MFGKWQRTYRLDIFTPAGKQLTIEPPFTIRFNITRNTLASANKAKITIINLGKPTRNQIFKDRYSTTEYWRVLLQAGYNNRLHTVFQGNIYEAFSYKEKTEWITDIDAYDGMDAIQNGYTAQTVAAGTSNADIFSSVINDMPNAIAGLVGGSGEGSSPRGRVLLGQSSEVLNRESNGQFFIDNETVNILSDDEVISGDVVLLDPTDLLATPKRRETFLDVKCLFQPQLQVGRVYEIRSIEERFNGQYKIMGFSHDVEISGADGGNAETNIQLYFGANGLQEIS